MQRVDARPNIASMKDEFPVRDMAIMQFPANAMGQLLLCAILA